MTAVTDWRLWFARLPPLYCVHCFAQVLPGKSRKFAPNYPPGVQKAKNASANATMANTTVSIAAATKRKRSSCSGVSFHNMKPSCARGEDARAGHKPTMDEAWCL